MDEYAPQTPQLPDISCDTETVVFDPITEAERRLKTRVLQHGKLVDLYKEDLSLDGKVVPWHSKAEILRFFSDKNWVTLKLENHQYQIWDARKQVFLQPSSQIEYWYPDFQLDIEESYNLIAAWVYRWAAALGWKRDGGFYFTKEDFVSLAQNGVMIADDNPDILIARIDNTLPDFYLISEKPVVLRLSLSLDPYQTPFIAMKFYGQALDKARTEAIQASLLEDFPAFTPKK